MINGACIATGTISADKIDVDDLSALEANIGGWSITESALQKGTTIFLSDDSIWHASLTSENDTSPLRIGVGQTKTEEVVVTVVSSRATVEESVFLDKDPISVKIVSCVNEGNGGVDEFYWETPIINGKEVYIEGYNEEGPYEGNVSVTLECTYYAYATRILEDGSLYANNADIEGVIKSSSGLIGGWSITESALQKGSTRFITDDSDPYESLVTTGGTSPTRIEAGRADTATGQAVVTVTSYDGVVDEVVRFNRELASVEIVSYVDEDRRTDDFTWETLEIDGGNVCMKGSHDQGLYNGNVSVTLKYTYYTPVTRILDDGSLYAGAVKLGAGILGSDNSLFLGTTDMLGVDGFFDGADINNWRMTVGSKFGVTSDGKLYTSAAQITGGIIRLGSGDSFSKVGSDGAVFGARWNSMRLQYSTLTSRWSDWSFDLTEGLNEVVFGSYSEIDGMPHHGVRATLDVNDCTSWGISVTNGGYGAAGISFSMNSNMANCYAELVGTWKGSLTASSDRNLKNSIEYLSDEYDTLFNKLRPVRFKFNNGTSGRYHTGFIAQDVESSILDSGLTTDDAALFVRFTTTDAKDKSDTITYGLRYDEFISLNTWQIQKLKARVAELEEKLNELIGPQND
jgi:hypothetical protein